MQTFVSLSDEKSNVSIITDCVREYQIVGQDYSIIALTLFRSIPMMGKPNLKDRPGRASGMNWETNGTKLLKDIEFNFAINVSDKDFNHEEVFNLAKEYTTESMYYQAADFKNIDKHFLMNKPKIENKNYDYSLFEFTNKKCIMSTLKKLEEENGLLLRLFNPSDINEVEFSLNLQKAQAVKLDEKTPENINIINNESGISIPNIKTCKIISLKI